MGFKKCPICELNYINESKVICDICHRARTGAGVADDNMICYECGERSAISELGLCARCLRDTELSKTERGISSSAVASCLVNPMGVVDIEAEFESMELPAEEDDAIPDSEYEEMSRAFSMEYDEQTDLELNDDAASMDDGENDGADENNFYKNTNKRGTQDTSLRP